MRNILKSCQPRQDILEGAFNPEIFTASLSEVIRFYHQQNQGLHPIYTDAEQFFTQGTYATDGLKMVLNDVFARLAGDGSTPAIHRLETAFGGGKTHTLIACAHIAAKGVEIAEWVKDIIDPQLLPPPGEISVVGIPGVDLPVHKPHGTQLVPYTLWGEIAFQIGGQELYQAVQADADAHAAPGRNYFETVFKDRKILLMIDELAQYSARLAAAHAGGSDQLAAFLMSLHEYARSHTGLAVVLTLAGAKDAFAKETSQLAKLLSHITGREMNTDDALSIGQHAVDGIASVVARDATAVIPVRAVEISRVLAKRLFVSIDEAAATQTASAYREMYHKNASLLPDEALRDDFHDRMISHYPFHPTFIDFLNFKLAAYENFQGTRGVLRVLALAARILWRNQAAIPMIHTCHLDLRNARMINEIVGRTGAGDLLAVLNADVGGADTNSLTGGRSNAEMADRKNPHPQGWPLYEYTWKTVFLHSLVGRSQGLASNIFGLTEQDALFAIAFPGLTPPQAAEALREIPNSAYYLRFEQGRYYASLDPSVNIALAKLRRGVEIASLDALLETTARKVVSADTATFQIATDVAVPEHIADNQGKPCLALIALNADPINIEKMITTAGPNQPRIEQNLVFLLVPDTVVIQSGAPQAMPLFKSGESETDLHRRKLYELARTVMAMRKLKKNPQNYGINPSKLDRDEFKQRWTERENSLVTAVAQTYRNLWYPSAGGQIVCKEIRTSGGEGGAPVMEQIRKTLIEDGELITPDHINRSGLMALKKLFFDAADVIKIAQIRANFNRLRKWPLLTAPNLLDQLIRAGVERGVWCVFRMGAETSIQPDQFFSQTDGGLPLNVVIDNTYSLITPEGAKQRGWGRPIGPSIQRIQDRMKKVTYQTPVIKFTQLSDTIVEDFGDVPEKDVKEGLSKLIQEERLIAYKGDLNPEKKPDLIKGAQAAFYMPEADDVIITPAKAAEKGWLRTDSRAIKLGGQAFTDQVWPLLKRIGTLYQQGGRSRIDILDMADLELPNGGTLRISLEKATPETLKDLDEFFDSIAGLIQFTEKTTCDLEINDPKEDCPFIQALKKKAP